MQGLEELRTNKPEENAERLEVGQFMEKLRGLWFFALGIEAEAAMLSSEGLVSLGNYFYVCELMIRCKEEAVRVAPNVWAGIESRILVLSSSEATAE
ncbi:MAG: hypothetical protein DCF15_17880 [Phormidesmis priestleyi]|uniref:NACHT conflict system C-terminal helical domain-containing protein n=1 Tax=Phormidesmis priestleyi TaxID=268141 RepID=A0A2W4YQL5_9CYAN|nr:MAG: hypothetical protein DCF15_17880 [Phormidesmis priestleyi]